MDIRAAYSQSDNPQLHYVLGLRLAPYSAGHERLLAAMENSFIVVAQSLDIEDLIAGAWICCQPWREAKAALKSPWRNLLLRWWGFRARKLNPATEILKFRAYLRQARDNENKNWQFTENPDAAPSPTPGLHSLRIYLMREIRLTEAEFWDRPYLLNLADYWACLESKGDVKPMSETDREMFAAAKS